MPTDKRRRKLSQLKALKGNQRGLLTNARCLSEGVDVPSLDGVAFIDPRSSQIDIIQAVGRAIRLSENKKAGTIVLPVFIGKSDDPEQALEEGNFKPIWDVLNALKAHDDVLADELNQIRTELGRKGGGKVDPNALSKITIDLPLGIDGSFGDSLRTVLVEKTTASWEFWYGLLEQYVDESGNCLVPLRYKTDSDLNLGSWVVSQRGRWQSLSLDRKTKLQALKGWSLDPIDEQWDKGYTALKNYVDEYGDCLVPRDHITLSEYKLGSWVRQQRTNKRRSKLSSERIKKLQSLEGWEWNPLEAQWRAGYKALKKYSEHNGDCIVPRNFIDEDGFELVKWVTIQRKFRKKMSIERSTALESLKGWSWDPLADNWETAYLELKKYCEESGDCLVNQSLVLGNGFKLGFWTSRQRQFKEVMPSDRRIRLEALNGWVWDRVDEKWENSYFALKSFSEEYGHCLVPTNFKLNDVQMIGRWVSRQRQTKEMLSNDRRMLLESLKGWSWDPLADNWEKGYQALKNYSEDYGDCLVPQRFKLSNEFRLGAWVDDQRVRWESISLDRKSRLEALKGWSLNPIADKWEKGYLAVKKYSEEHGNCLIPARFSLHNGYKLGAWVRHQKEKQETLTVHQKNKLESLKGWSWDFQKKD
jgi:hypothetical protein